VATPTIEEYLEAIYVMESENPPVISARVAEAMRISAPTMSDTLRRLIQQGYVSTGKSKVILLTDRGREAAEALVRRHRLSERWLVDALGMDWSTVHKEACRLEHALSSEVEERLARALGNPSTCPHGNPIPGSGQELRQGVALSRVSPGEEVVLLRIAPEGERDRRFLSYLTGSGLVPGARFRVVDAAPWAGIITVSVGGVTAIIGVDAASHLWVEPAQ